MQGKRKREDPEEGGKKLVSRTMSLLAGARIYREKRRGREDFIGKKGGERDHKVKTEFINFISL